MKNNENYTNKKIFIPDIQLIYIYDIVSKYF